MKFKLGCDPEIFLQDAAGALIASCDRIGGSKEFPRPLPIGDGFAVQEDNVAIEFNTPPAEDANEFSNNISKTIEYLSGLIGEQGLRFNHSSAQYFPDEQLWHPMASVFGCDPDFNAWLNGARNPAPKADDHRLRSAGGHVHVGIQVNKRAEVISIVQLMDLMLGVPSTLQDQGALRKKLYGKAGAFRFKPYGLEYRTLSNYWVFDDTYRQWVWRATERAIQAHEDKMLFLDDKDHILEAINNDNKDAARWLVDKYNLDVVHHA